MVSIEEAKKIVNSNLQNTKIKKYVEYKDLFIFIVTNSDPLEEDFDPFYSVNKRTGYFQGCPIMLPEYFGPVMDLFSRTKEL